MYWIWTLFYVIFHLHAGKTEILMKYSNIVRKQARRRWWNKAGCWRVKILVNSLSCESLSWSDAVCWPEHIHLTKWKTPASSKSATVRPGLRTCQSSYRPSRRSLPGCVRESWRERSKGKNGGIKNYYSPTDRQGYQWSRGKVNNIMQYERN